jgi:hypothetical protein
MSAIVPQKKEGGVSAPLDYEFTELSVVPAPLLHRAEYECLPLDAGCAPAVAL